MKLATHSSLFAAALALLAFVILESCCSSTTTTRNNYFVRAEAATIPLDCTPPTQRIDCGVFTCNESSRTCMPCTDDDQCWEPSMVCEPIKGHCEVANLFSSKFDAKYFFVIVFAFATCCLGIVAGVGGGGILVPLYAGMAGLPISHAVYISLATVVGQSVVNIPAVLFQFDPAFPAEKGPVRPLAAMDIMALWFPAAAAGTIIGQLLSRFFPSWLRMVGLFILASLVTYRVVLKARAQRKLDNEDDTQEGEAAGRSEEMKVRRKMTETEDEKRERLEKEMRRGPLADANLFGDTVGVMPKTARILVDEMEKDATAIEVDEHLKAKAMDGVSKTQKSKNKNTDNNSKAPSRCGEIDGECMQRADSDLVMLDGGGGDKVPNRGRGGIVFGEGTSPLRGLASPLIVDRPPVTPVDGGNFSALERRSDSNTNNNKHIDPPASPPSPGGGTSAAPPHLEEDHVYHAVEARARDQQNAFVPPSPALPTATTTVAPSTGHPADISRCQLLEWCILVLVMLVGFLLARLGLHEDSGAGIECGSAGFWLFVFGAMLLQLLCAFLYRIRMARIADEVARGELHPVNATVEWNVKNSIVLPLTSTLSGLGSSLLGIGGGMITNPLLLEAGLSPERVSATGSLITGLVAFQSMLVATGGDVAPNLDYVLTFAAVGALSTLFGRFYLIREIRKRKATWLIVLCLGVILVVTLLCTVALGVYNLVKLSEYGAGVGFGQLCAPLKK